MIPLNHKLGDLIIIDAGEQSKIETDDKAKKQRAAKMSFAKCTLDIIFKLIMT